MAGLDKLIVVSDDHAISFGNHQSKEKQKLEGFEWNGDLFKVKTHDEITRFEKNGRLLYESVPGTTVYDLKMNSENMTFSVDTDAEDAQITIELEAGEEYKVYIDDVQVGKVKANLSGKISFSIDFAGGKKQVKITKL